MLYGDVPLTLNCIFDIHKMFVSWVFHVIFSFIYFILFDTLSGMRAFRKPFSILYVFIQYSDCKSFINNESKYMS